MDSHSQRIAQRRWQREHSSQIEALVLAIKKTADYEFDFVRTDKVVEMRKKRIYAFGLVSTKFEWTKFLNNRGIDLNTFDLNTS